MCINFLWMLITSYHKCSGFKRPKFIILEVRSLKWAKIKVSVELRSFLEALGASLFPSWFLLLDAARCPPSVLHRGGGRGLKGAVSLPPVTSL